MDGEFVRVVSLAYLYRWPIEECEIETKHTVLSFFSAVRPYHPKERLESNLNFTHNDLKIDFKTFIKHCVELAAAFEMVGPGPSTAKKRSRSSFGRNTPAQPKTEKDKTDTNPTRHRACATTKRTFKPDCSFYKGTSKQVKYWIDDFQAPSDA